MWARQQEYCLETETQRRKFYLCVARPLRLFHLGQLTWPDVALYSTELTDSGENTIELIE